MEEGNAGAADHDVLFFWCLQTVVDHLERAQSADPSGASHLSHILLRYRRVLMAVSEARDSSESSEALHSVLSTGLIYLLLCRVLFDQTPPTIDRFILKQCQDTAVSASSASPPMTNRPVMTFAILLRWLSIAHEHLCVLEEQKLHLRMEEALASGVRLSAEELAIESGFLSSSPLSGLLTLLGIDAFDSPEMDTKGLELARALASADPEFHSEQHSDLLWILSQLHQRRYGGDDNGEEEEEEGVSVPATKTPKRKHRVKKKKRWNRRKSGSPQTQSSLESDDADRPSSALHASAPTSGFRLPTVSQSIRGPIESRGEEEEADASESLQGSPVGSIPPPIVPPASAVSSINVASSMALFTASTTSDDASFDYGDDDEPRFHSRRPSRRFLDEDERLLLGSVVAPLSSFHGTYTLPSVVTTPRIGGSMTSSPADDSSRLLLDHSYDDEALEARKSFVDEDLLLSTDPFADVKEVGESVNGRDEPISVIRRSFETLELDENMFLASSDDEMEPGSDDRIDPDRSSSPNSSPESDAIRQTAVALGNELQESLEADRREMVVESDLLADSVARMPLPKPLLVEDADVLPVAVASSMAAPIDSSVEEPMFLEDSVENFLLRDSKGEQPLSASADDSSDFAVVVEETAVEKSVEIAESPTDLSRADLGIAEATDDGAVDTAEEKKPEAVDAVPADVAVPLVPRPTGRQRKDKFSVMKSYSSVEAMRKATDFSQLGAIRRPNLPPPDADHAPSRESSNHKRRRRRRRKRKTNDIDDDNAMMSVRRENELLKLMLLQKEREFKAERASLQQKFEMERLRIEEESSERKRRRQQRKNSSQRLKLTELPLETLEPEAPIPDPGPAPPLPTLSRTPMHASATEPQNVSPSPPQLPPRSLSKRVITFEINSLDASERRERERKAVLRLKQRDRRRQQRLRGRRPPNRKARSARNARPSPPLAADDEVEVSRGATAAVVQFSSPPSDAIVPKQRGSFIRSNLRLVRNAISHVCLAGFVNEPEKLSVLDAIHRNRNLAHRFLIRIRSDSSPKFRALYGLLKDSERQRRRHRRGESASNSMGEFTKLCGRGPTQIRSEDVSAFYRFDSGTKRFLRLRTNEFSVTVDGITIPTTLRKQRPLIPRHE